MSFILGVASVTEAQKPFLKSFRGRPSFESNAALIRAKKKKEWERKLLDYKDFASLLQYLSRYATLLNTSFTSIFLRHFSPCGFLTCPLQYRYGFSGSPTEILLHALTSVSNILTTLYNFRCQKEKFPPTESDELHLKKTFHFPPLI